MKAMEIGRHDQHHARHRFVRFSTELLNLCFQTRPQIWQEQSYLYNELSSLSAGWRRSADRTRLQANSLLTGNFTGNFAISGPCAPGSTQDTAVLQRFLAQFPKQIIREKISKNREFLGDIREFGPQKVRVHFSHPAGPLSIEGPRLMSSPAQ